MKDDWRAEARIFPIQIREDLFVRIQNLPHDLTKAEAERICRVVMALSEGTEHDQG